MSLFNSTDRRFAQAIADLSYCNPFLPERIEWERVALGDQFDETEAVWSKRGDWESGRPNVLRLQERTEALATRLRDELAGGAKADAAEIRLYEDLVNYLLYHRYRPQLAVASAAEVGKPHPLRFWKQFLNDYQHFLVPLACGPSEPANAAHLFACFYQLNRAFMHIFDNLIGSSLPAARLRAAVWQSVFTHDMRRYRRALYDRMVDFTALVTGPSGTGKELVARAIGLSRFVPFDPVKQQFTDTGNAFHPLNLSALSATLIESELFGHCRGAFTGAVDDRTGWLEICQPHGTVFLDEIGDLDTAIQVKLLRVLQVRKFQRLGETTDRYFPGKIIAATNRDLAARIAEGAFREDLYYRLCSDIVSTPTLREQLADCPGDLANLILFITKRIVGEEAESLAREIEAWIVDKLGRDYTWPGNIRELEQCVRNVIVRQHYQPRRVATVRADDPRQETINALVSGSLTADELLCRYCTQVYAETGSYEQAAERLHLDRRTVKAKVDPELLARLKSSTAKLR